MKGNEVGDVTVLLDGHLWFFPLIVDDDDDGDGDDNDDDNDDDDDDGVDDDDDDDDDEDDAMAVARLHCSEFFTQDVVRDGISRVGVRVGEFPVTEKKKKKKKIIYIYIYIYIPNRILRWRALNTIKSRAKTK